MTLVQLKTAKVILISNEVGLGIVPDNALARSFRDLAGSAHPRRAEITTGTIHDQTTCHFPPRSAPCPGSARSGPGRRP